MHLVGWVVRSRKPPIARSNIRAASTLSGISPRPLTSILIANRGEIALRVGRTAAENGIRVTVVYTDPDAKSQHALSSPNAVNLGHSSAYLDGQKIIHVARQNGCQGIHPGYGFLSENSAFARECVEAGLIFIGPPWKAIEAMGNKSRSKEIMIRAGVPCIPGYHGANQEPERLEREAEKIGFPVMLKAVKGGGGKGMRIAFTANDFHQQLQSAKSEAKNSFGDDTMLVEKYISTPRHIEVQIFADKFGNCVALGERDCSIQRRHQKILEESPAPNLDEATRQDLWQKARSAALAVGYEGAGTVEFIFDNDTGEFFFMEMNTRLQVEHPVTEMITGEDLVRWQFLVAEGKPLPLSQQALQASIAQRGHAIEARIYAENPDLGFIPTSGTLTHLQSPPTSDTVRVDSGFVAGDEVSAHYDPMISKLIVRGSDREHAIRELDVALQQYQVAGIPTNIQFLRRVCQNATFVQGQVETGFIEKQKDYLFAELKIATEVFIQAALNALHFDARRQTVFHSIAQPGFTSPLDRTFDFCSIGPDGQSSSEIVSVRIQKTACGLYDAQVGDANYRSLTCSLDTQTHILRTFFPDQRIESTIIQDGADLTVFQHGEEYRIRMALPSWTAKALGVKETKHSVLAPMPCKVLKIDVEEGQEVTKNQALVVIESMKMETTIRSPQDGKILRVVHKAGDMCKAGVALVEFEEP